MNSQFLDSFLALKKYCEEEDFKGWDPYDGLTSKLFNTLPYLKTNKLARLAWIQFFKRSPINFRKISLVEKRHNAKGIALFLTGYCNLYAIDPSQKNLDTIQYLGDLLLKLQNLNYSGSCWGYYFDWQARAFFQPKNTPTVVATSFVTDALLNAYEIIKNEAFLSSAISSSKFVLNDLNKTYDENGDFAFSYSPIDNTQVFNASLLGARLLSKVYLYTNEQHLLNEAHKAVAYVCNKQQENGSWAYGTLPYHKWVDNFHTGFNLECIQEYILISKNSEFNQAIEKGLTFYIQNFFLENGISKYYHNKIYPIDIHAPAQLIVTLYKLDKLNQYKDIVEKVTRWTINNMQDKSGYFYYQKEKNITFKIPYMRWAQAWMFYSLSYYLRKENSVLK